MLILGLGLDICRIARIEAAIGRHGQRFLDRVFTPHEQARAEARPAIRFGTYAKRFAAKEACAKALGTGLRQGVRLRDMGVVNLLSGAPTLALAGGAAARLAAITPVGHSAMLHLTLTDDHPLAQALVVITASPA